MSGPVSSPGSGTAGSAEFSGRVALVTGGAGDGIGSATARRLGQDGASVVIVDSHEKRTREVSERIAAETGARVLGMAGDIADRGRMDEILASTEEQLGPVDILVNNAALNVLGDVVDMDTADWDRVMDVDLTACFYLIRQSLPAMMSRGLGSIINVTSVAGYLGSGREGPYAASKAALHSLTRSVAFEAGPSGVRCNAVATGIIWSKFVRKYADRMEPEIQRTPMRRIGDPEDVAELIAFLCSKRSSFITGETINISGGWYMSP
ncbi:MAG: SDR family NAD(P)-dependent oxidoreductase [Myxococcota bacterium]|jgi:NAD(P)-dependent dehydrogenase (short-subunit alcohol dehydrogenase family)